MRKHTTMSIPKALYESVKELIDSVPELGYTTPAEFCKDAIRRRISGIRKEYTIGKNDVEYIITEMKRAMNDHEDYKSIFDSVNCALAVFSNPDGALITWNKSFLDIFGYSENDVKGKSFYDFIAPEDVLHVKENFRATIEGKDTEDTCVVRAVDANGTIISVEVDCSLYTVGNHVKGVSVLVRKADGE